MATQQLGQQAASRGRPVGLAAIIGVLALVAVIALLLLVFYKPFPTVTIINAADEPLKNVKLETLGSETHGETHELGTLAVGEIHDVVVRSYEVTVRSLAFDLAGKHIEHKADPLPITPGQSWRLTVEPDGKVTGSYVY